MKIAHIADVHLGEFAGPIIDNKNARMMDIVKCMDFSAEKVKNEEPDLIVISGDLFHKSKLWADEMLNEIIIAANWLRKLAAIAPTILMFGTANHDSLRAFENIKEMGIPSLFVITEPKLLDVCTKNGLVQIVAVPGVDRGYFRAKFPGLDKEDENEAISQALGNIIVGLGLKAKESKSDAPLILMSHYTVTGCALENGEQMFMNADLVIPTTALQKSNYDLVCLGHIHKAQEVPNCGRPVFYSGPLNGITFNEEGQEKGFWIHELGKKSIDSKEWVYGGSDFIKTPNRNFKTLNWDEETVKFFIENPEEPFSTSNCKDKIVRVIYSCSDEVNKQFNRKTLEKKLYAEGAFYVSEIKPSKIITTTDKTAMSENDTVEQNLKLWLKKQGHTEIEIKQILYLALPLINEVTATLPTGKLTGIFEPVSLEVKDYRSYREESFDFTKVKFATVNGPNGIGKSSFFMDAIADCLYEETREGELTGWINNSDEVKSGAITFEFKIGKDLWKVIRTRTKSGKATLTLQKYYKNNWKDESCSRKDQTQEKILNILCMDSLTFKSCALIMQDNYGVFLEADKSDRMSVLSNILGLNIYESLENIVKEKARDINRDIEKLKAEIATLDEKSKDTLSSEEELKNLEESKATQKKILEENENKLKDLQEKALKFKTITDKITNLTENLAITSTEIRKRETLRERLTEDVANAQNIVNDEKIINEKVSDYEKSKEKITEIKTKKEIYLQKINESHKIQNEINDLKFKIDKAQKIVDVEDTINAKIKEYEETKEQIAAIKIKKPIYEQKKNELKSITQEANKAVDEEKNFNQQIRNILHEIQDENNLRNKVEKFNLIENKLQTMNELKDNYENAYKKSLELKQKVSMAKKDYESQKENFEIQLANYNKKTKLINDSNCPVENPTCNFLKDAIEAKSKISVLENKLKNLDHSKIDRLEKEYSTLVQDIKNINYNSKDHDELKIKLEDLRSSKEKLMDIENKKSLLEVLEKQKLSVVEKGVELINKQENLAEEVSELSKEIEPLQKLEDTMSNLEHWYKGKDELPKAKEILESSKPKFETLIKNKETLLEEIKTLESETKQLEVLQDKLVLLEIYLKKKDNIPAAKQLISTSLERIKTLDDEITVMEKEMIQLESEKNKIENEEKSLYVSENSIEDEEKLIQSIREKLSNLDIEIGKRQVQIEAAEKDKSEKIEKNKKLSVRANVYHQYEVLTKAFSIDGVPFQIVRSIVPELSNQANEILSQMTGGKMAIEMKTDKILKNKKEVNALEIWISDYQRGTMPYLSRSGGQKVKAALSVAFALADVKAKRNGIQLGMMFIDEPPFLDKDGVQAYCDALELMSTRYTDMRVIAISHDPEMKARFPEEIEVIDSGDAGSKIIFNH